MADNGNIRHCYLWNDGNDGIMYFRFCVIGFYVDSRLRGNDGTVELFAVVAFSFFPFPRVYGVWALP